MNIFLKYIIYFLLGIMINLILKDNFIEGFNSDAFTVLSRIIGLDESGSYKTDYIGCKNYNCNNRKKYNYGYLNNITDFELIEIVNEVYNLNCELNNESSYIQKLNDKFDININFELSDFIYKVNIINESTKNYKLNKINKTRSEYFQDRVQDFINNKDLIFDSVQDLPSISENYWKVPDEEDIRAVHEIGPLQQYEVEYLQYQEAHTEEDIGGRLNRRQYSNILLKARMKPYYSEIINNLLTSNDPSENMYNNNSVKWISDQNYYLDSSIILEIHDDNSIYLYLKDPGTYLLKEIYKAYHDPTKPRNIFSSPKRIYYAFPSQDEWDEPGSDQQDENIVIVSEGEFLANPLQYEGNSVIFDKAGRIREGRGSSRSTQPDAPQFFEIQASRGKEEIVRLLRNRETNRDEVYSVGTFNRSSGYLLIFYDNNPNTLTIIPQLNPSFDSNTKEKIIDNILKTLESNNFVDKEYQFKDNDYQTCNNEFDYSPNADLGKKCSDEICCFNTKCDSNDSRKEYYLKNQSIERRNNLELNPGQCRRDSCYTGECINFDDSNYYCNCPNGYYGSTCSMYGGHCSLNFCPDNCKKDRSTQQEICECYDGLIPSNNGENSFGATCDPPKNLCQNSGKNVKKDSNCLSIEECKNNYFLHCCTEDIPDDIMSAFNSLDINEDNYLSYDEINASTSLISYTDIQQTDFLNNLRKFLTLTRENQNFKMDINDFHDFSK